MMSEATGKPSDLKAGVLVMILITIFLRKHQMQDIFPHSVTGIPRISMGNCNAFRRAITPNYVQTLASFNLLHMKLTFTTNY